MPFMLSLIGFFLFGNIQASESGLQASRPVGAPSNVEVNVLAFGAKGDGVFLNTSALQSAIDSVAAGGGGKLVFPKGRFLTGSIVLKSGVELCLKENSVILGTTDPVYYRGLHRWKALILADAQTNIAISGKGTIDGQGRQLALHIDDHYYRGELGPRFYNLPHKRPSEAMRPQLLEMVECKNINISGITIKNSACWVQTYDRCEELDIHHVRVESDAYWNNDGIDISDCKNVRITDCFVNSADDGICLKSHFPTRLNENIYIANCTVRSSASAIKLGTASVGGFKNVQIEKIKVFDTFRSAIAIESVDGGILEDINIKNIVARNTGNAIFIRLGHRNADDKVGTLRNVSIKNVKVEVAFDRPDRDYDLRGPDPSFFHNPFPCSITGIPGHPVENISLENIAISFPGRGNDGMANLPLHRLKDVPEALVDYPEFSMFGELPCWGFYVRHAQGLTMKNVSLTTRESDFRPAFVFDDVEKLGMNLIRISKANASSPIILKNVYKESIHNLSTPGLTAEAVQKLSQ